MVEEKKANSNRLHGILAQFISFGMCASAESTQPRLMCEGHMVVALATNRAVLSNAGASAGPRLTLDARGGVRRYVGVDCDLGVQDAAVGVGVHLQGVQQLSVVLHSVVIRAVLLRDQPGSALCKHSSHKKKGRSERPASAPRVFPSLGEIKISLEEEEEEEAPGTLDKGSSLSVRQTKS